LSFVINFIAVPDKSNSSGMLMLFASANIHH
jgi:hypothetical protein